MKNALKKLKRCALHLLIVHLYNSKSADSINGIGQLPLQPPKNKKKIFF